MASNDFSNNARARKKSSFCPAVMSLRQKPDIQYNGFMLLLITPNYY